MQLMVDSLTDAREPEPIQILVVEDESIIAFNLQETLETLEYSVPAIAISGEQAIQTAAELRPDLVLMDIRIRGEMDGIQAAEQIWDQFQIPVIYVTGHSDRSTVERAKLTAPFGYLLKPIRERELYVAIESALQRCERERWISTILKEMGDAVIVVDLVGRIKFLNAICERLTGWNFREARDRPLMEVFKVIHEQTQSLIENPVTTVLRQGLTVQLEEDLLLTARDGRTVPIANSIAPLRDNTGTVTGAVLVFQDITTRRQAEERNRAIAQAMQLQQQMAELERLNRLKDDFLSTVSHELRTPIANIKMAIHMLEIILNQQGLLTVRNNPDVERLGRYVEILRNQCNQEMALINDLLDLQRLNADRYELELTSISLADWLVHVIESFEGRAQERQLTLQVDIASDLPPLLSDLPSLNRIFVELLNNACKYTPPGERILVTVDVTEPPQSENMAASTLTASSFLMQVCNTGISIPTEELTRIFDPFYRIPRSDRWNQGGTGLGLALIKKLVDCLRGSIRVESDPEQTCFVLTFPVLPSF